MTDRNRQLGALSRAVAKGAVPAEEIGRLARDIAELAASVEPGEPSARTLRDLATATRQLETIAERSGGLLHPRSLDELPPVLGHRVGTRLQNAAGRLGRRSEAQAAQTSARRGAARAAARRKPDPSFRCAQDFRACMAKARSKSSRFWCHVAMVVCLARTVLPMVERMQRGG